MPLEILAYAGWGIVAVMMSGPFADQHLRLVLTAASALALLLFCVPVGALWLSTRRHPRARTAALCVWSLAYLMLLYIAPAAVMSA
jgi:hypothetical protein